MLSFGSPYDNTILSLNYWSALSEQLMNVSDMLNVVTATLNTLLIECILMITSFTIIICLSIIPIFIFLKKKVKKHIEIYDLIASV